MKTLIDSASKVCGSDSKLAKRMDVAQSVISDMRHRGRTVTPETAMLLADIAGEDIEAAIMESILSRSEGTKRGEVLREISKKMVKNRNYWLGFDTAFSLCAKQKKDEKFGRR